MKTRHNPVFSLAELSDGSRVEELKTCTTERGFFYLTDCGLSEQAHQLARDTAMDVFERSTPAQKEVLTTSLANLRRGFSALGAESTAIVTSTGKYSDYSTCYSMGVGNNVFPSHYFEKVWTEYFNGLYSVARDVARAIFTSVGGCDANNVEELLDCDPLLRLRYFPEVPENRVAELEPLRMALHYDLSLLTLIHQTPCANGFVSLQVVDGDEVVGLPVIPDSMIVLCGAVATVVTGGLVIAPKHHVAAPPAAMRVGSGRTSSVFFLRPRSSFAFSVAKAKQYGLKVSLDAETATFGEWIGNNYVAMLTPAASRAS